MVKPRRSSALATSGFACWRGRATGSPSPQRRAARGRLGPVRRGLIAAHGRRRDGRSDDAAVHAGAGGTGWTTCASLRQAVVCPDGRGGPGAADRVRERREACCWRVRRPGSGKLPCGSRSAPAAAASSASCRRERAAVRDRRGLRHRPRLVFGRVVVSLISVGPGQMVFDLTPNWHVLAFTTAVAVATALLFGVAPALRRRRRSVAGVERSRAGDGAAFAAVALARQRAGGALARPPGRGRHCSFARCRTCSSSTRASGPKESCSSISRRAARRCLRTCSTRLERARCPVRERVDTYTAQRSCGASPSCPPGSRCPSGTTAFFVGAGSAILRDDGDSMLAGRDFTDRDTADAAAVAVVNERSRRDTSPDESVGQHLAASVAESRETSKSSAS